MLEVKCKGNSQVLIALYMMGQGLEYKNISCGCHIVFVVLQAAYYSKAPVTQKTLDCNLILKHIITEIYIRKVNKTPLNAFD